MTDTKPPPPGIDKIHEEDLQAGAGAYSKESQLVQRLTRCQCVVMVILDGDRGTGFDIAVREDCVSNVVWSGLAGELERLARIIRDRAPTLLAEAVEKQRG